MQRGRDCAKRGAVFMEFVIVTGMSGAGKSRTINALEDIDFYCVDNMPVRLLPKIAELCIESSKKKTRVAVVCDSRGGEFFNDFFVSLEELKNQGFQYKILFLDCADNVLIKRYKESRRKHPLMEEGENMSIEECILKERELLNPVKQRADFLIDTTFFAVTQIKEQMVSLFLGDVKLGLTVRCISFGFKYGSPSEADLVFDVRCLPNPFYVETLRHLTGLDEEVRDYVLKWPQTMGFTERFIDMIDYLLPLYINEGKSQLVVAIGCTGGKHRSVALTQLLFEHLMSKELKATVHHRDISKL